ncbi:hypothetical protein Tdes44962_MAKER08351 [Teratosphaeria destructans]|uniref:Uncharacterized protein n=1 Tax=Teratosphaeria destructans TaxID=418781 RepID=A0A9W7SWS9_9PEZI|nr:hypothetical protein Tdes44962_MAKER08351 [Teratosphaeria destructans]
MKPSRHTPFPPQRKYASYPPTPRLQTKRPQRPCPGFLDAVQIGGEQDSDAWGRAVRAGLDNVRYDEGEARPWM